MCYSSCGLFLSSKIINLHVHLPQCKILRLATINMYHIYVVFIELWSLTACGLKIMFFKINIFFRTWMTRIEWIYKISLNEKTPRWCHVDKLILYKIVSMQMTEMTYFATFSIFHLYSRMLVSVWCTIGAFHGFIYSCQKIILHLQCKVIRRDMCEHVETDLFFSDSYLLSSFCKPPFLKPCEWAAGAPTVTTS